MKTTISLGREINTFILLFFVFIGNTITIYAQDYLDICATEDTTAEYLYFDNPPNYLNSLEPLVLNIYFWGIRDTGGVPNAQDLTEEKALAAVQKLNINFNPYKIYFKYRGFSSFDSPANVEWLQYNYDCSHCADFPFEEDPTSQDYCINSPNVYNIDPDGFGRLSRCQRGALISYGNSMGYMEPNAINIYVPRGTTDFGGSGGNPIILPTSNLEGNTFIHEMGHYFGLQHTFTDWIKLIDGIPDPTYVNCEHVTRNSTDPNYNAHNRGDRITDTAAMPEFRREYCTLNGLPASQCSEGAPFYFQYYDLNNCEYIGTFGQNDRSDCQGTLYQIDPIQSQNYMSYALGACMSNFTNEQVFNMRNRINTMQNRLTTVAALYEPYKGSYYLVGPDPDPRDKPLFQPGFNYNFKECDCTCPQPIPYEDTSFTYTNNALLTISKYEEDYSIITHPNHSAIQIDLGFLVGQYSIPRRCYDNNNRTPIGGSVIKFNDNVFNNNVTITPQDSTQINSPNLINALQPGLYNIIKTDSEGSSQETVILKENN